MLHQPIAGVLFNYSSLYSAVITENWLCLGTGQQLGLPELWDPCSMEKVCIKKIKKRIHKNSTSEHPTAITMMLSLQTAEHYGLQETTKMKSLNLAPSCQHSLLIVLPVHHKLLLWRLMGVSAFIIISREALLPLSFRTATIFDK